MYRANPSTGNESRYKQYGNKLNSIIRHAKRIYHYDKFDEVIKDLKQTWQFISESSARKKHAQTPRVLVTG